MDNAQTRETYGDWIERVPLESRMSPHTTGGLISNEIAGLIKNNKIGWEERGAGCGRYKAPMKGRLRYPRFICSTSRIASDILLATQGPCSMQVCLSYIPSASPDVTQEHYDHS